MWTEGRLPDVKSFELFVFNFFRALSHHAEAYVRRSALFAASCILVALHPSHIASAMIEGNQEISNGLEWIRAWAVHISESDPDAECSRVCVISLSTCNTTRR